MANRKRLEGSARQDAVVAADHCCRLCGFSESALVAWSDVAAGQSAHAPHVVCEECLAVEAPELALPGSYRLAWAPDVPQTLMPHLARLAAWLTHAEAASELGPEAVIDRLATGMLPASLTPAAGGEPKVGPKVFAALKRRIELMETIFGGSTAQALSTGLAKLTSNRAAARAAIRVVPVKFDVERVASWRRFGTFHDVIGGE